MPRMNGGRAIAAALKAEGITHIFGIVGTHNSPMFDGVYNDPSFHVVTVRHEQGATMMAAGYARATGRIAAVFVVPGPGLTNAITGMGMAYSESAPMLVFGGQNAHGQLEREGGHFHELANSIPLAATVCGYTTRVATAADLPKVVREAMRAMRSKRPRPAYIEVPLDVQNGEADVTVLPPEIFSRPAGDPAVIARAAEARGWSTLIPYETVDRQSPQDFARWGRSLGEAIGIGLELVHRPALLAASPLTLVSRREYGAEVQAPTVILRFVLPKVPFWHRLAGRGFGRYSAGDLLGVLLQFLRSTLAHCIKDHARFFARVAETQRLSTAMLIKTVLYAPVDTAGGTWDILEKRSLSPDQVRWVAEDLLRRRRSAGVPSGLMTVMFASVRGTRSLGLIVVSVEKSR